LVLEAAKASETSVNFHKQGSAIQKTAISHLFLFAESLLQGTEALVSVLVTLLKICVYQIQKC
jgi:hypothetical protein